MPGGYHQSLQEYIAIKERNNLYAAAIAGDADAIAKLEIKADGEDENILHTESMEGNTERVQFILREFASKNILVKLNEYEQTALHLAAYNGQTEVAKVLIDEARHLPSLENDDNNDPVNSFQVFLRQTDTNSDTALCYAIMQGHTPLVKLLAEADPNHRHIQNNDGKTPMYIAAEKGYNEIVEIICTTCTQLSFDGPGDSSVFHAALEYMYLAKKEDANVMKTLFDGFLSSGIERNSLTLLNKIDIHRRTMLEIAVDLNYFKVVETILQENELVFESGGPNFASLKPLIYKATEKGYTEIADLLTLCYNVGAKVNEEEPIQDFIYAIQNHQEDLFLDRLAYWAEDLANFQDHLGWTLLHHAVYHEFNSLIDSIIKEQQKFGFQFVYEDSVTTPFHVAARKGYTFTLLHLMNLWPSSSSACVNADINGQNILHMAVSLATGQTKKEMVRGILKHCPKEYKNQLVNKQDNNGNTPLHLLVSDGCFVPELIKYEGLDMTLENTGNLTPPHMLYSDDQIIGEQVQIKIALEHIQFHLKRDIFSSSLLSRSRKESKDVSLKKKAKQMTDEKLAQMKEDARAVAYCFTDAIAGDPISQAALETKADILQEEGKTILHVECMRGDAEHVRYIVREFANRNLLVKVDTLKQNALHLAAHHGYTQVVEVLIDAAKLLPSSSAFIRQAKDQMGNTALHLAVLKGNIEIVKLLVEAGPDDSHVENNEGKTPIYIAAEKGCKDIVKEICSTCTALSLDGPDGRTTALHALIQNDGQEGTSDMIRMIIQAAKRWSSAEDPTLDKFGALFSRTDKPDESGRTVLQLAVDENNVDAVRLILEEDPSNQDGGIVKRNGLMRLIYKAIDKKYSDDIVTLLSQTYQVRINPDHKDALRLILAIKNLDEDSVSTLLENSRHLVTFTEDNGWTPLHYAAYHEFILIIGALIEAQEEVGHPFGYGEMASTPFDVAVEHGNTDTLVELMQLWPASSSVAADSPYTAVNKHGRNILHLAAADNNKDMVQAILKYCPEICLDKILKKQDFNGDTPLHLLISHGCFIPELIRHKELATMTRNNNNFTPRDMLYEKDDIVADQVRIKFALDDVQTNQLAWKCWPRRTEKKTDNPKRSKISQKKRMIKDGKFEKGNKLWMDAKEEQMKKVLERYKTRTNTQIIVTALITTVTFTVGFTMPGGLYQSGDVNEGLVVLSRKTAFNVFMVSDALALLMSTSSLFFYFLESMTEDSRQVSKLNAASTGLNIVSVIAMMLTFIAGTYVVLSHSPALAISVGVIGSLFFILIIVLLIMIVYQVPKNED